MSDRVLAVAVHGEDAASFELLEGICLIEAARLVPLLGPRVRLTIYANQTHPKWGPQPTDCHWTYQG